MNVSEFHRFVYIYLYLFPASMQRLILILSQSPQDLLLDLELVTWPCYCHSFKFHLPGVCVWYIDIELFSVNCFCMQWCLPVFLLSVVINVSRFSKLLTVSSACFIFIFLTFNLSLPSLVCCECSIKVVTAGFLILFPAAKAAPSRLHFMDEDSRFFSILPMIK